MEQKHTATCDASVARPAPAATRVEPADPMRGFKRADTDVVGALVMGADYRALGVVRSLGRRGIPIWVFRPDGQMMGVVSRYANRSLRCPPSDDGERQVDFLLKLASKEGVAGWVLFPTDDDAVALVSRHHESLAGTYRLTTPSWDTLQWGCDKRLLSRLAAALGIDHPWTYCPRDREDLAGVGCSFPVILKPAMRLGYSRLTKHKAWRAENRTSLLERYDELCKLIAPDMLMLQEILPGGGEAQFSYAALCRDGRPLASVGAVRLRQFPSDFGRFSTFVEIIDDSQVAESAARVLAWLRFTGLVEVEFKRDPRDGKLKILDLNPRVWGWLTLGGRAGVDFPYLAWLLARGEPVPEVHSRPGECWMRMGTDLPMAIQEILRGRLSLVEYLRSVRHAERAIFAWDDLAPGLLAPLLCPMMAGARVLKGEAL